MSILLSCQDLSKGFGPRPLFERLSFGLNEGERTGLIGPNGAGKSTLLRILAGLETPDSGEVSTRRGLRVGLVPQQEEPGAEREDLTVRQALRVRLEGLGWPDYELDRRVDDALERAGFPQPELPVRSLSGGWRKRLSLAGEAAREPDLLLLDEPTNHLDLEGVLWLERFLSGLERSFLVVTHDRRFLERVTNRVIELDKRYAEGHFSSPGNYSRFLENREALLSAQSAREDSVRNIVRNEIAWLRRGPKARTTKQQARIDRAGELMGELSELEYRGAQGRAADIDFTAGDRRSKRLAEAVAVVKSLGGRRLFGPLDLFLGPGDKLGLLGANGSGKSTLLKLLSGELEPDSGSVRRAEGLRVVTFDQQRAQLDLDLSLRRALCPNGEHVEYRGGRIHVKGWASRFLFRPEQFEMPLRLLSGGEQSRVLIARLMLEPADLLLLDEPTNDLDLRSLEVLESSMAEFPGALVLVTHDRYLLDRVCPRLLALDGKGGSGFFADLSQWEAWLRRPEHAAPAAAPAGAPAAPAAAKGLSGKELKELRAMEGRIHEAEARAEEARLALEDPAVASDAAELVRRQEDLEAARARIAALFARWEKLDARCR